jgi:hypothetical protein
MVSSIKFVSIAVLFGIALSTSSCVNLGNKGNSRARRAVNPAEVASPLVANSARPEMLAAINSIQIEQPVVASTGNPVMISSSDAKAVIEQVARETMTLKIISSAGSAKAKATPDAALHTELLRYEERSGSAFGGDPAVISFRMSIRTVPAGVEVWNGQYFFKQEALSENLLKIQERVGKNGLGAGWRSAHDIFRLGVASALDDFSSKREQRFMSKVR